ncbi:hypothetical protein SAML1593_23050 [Salmonella enterica]|nr:hypothetical protein SAML1593_23050 [Salmonella enterica]BCQ95980.1 hypothetical protein SAML1960_23000 [Salmonella enterica]BCR00671.1 hypothetical protein SAML2008_23790 [Salmonella enterica]
MPVSRFVSGGICVNFVDIEINSPRVQQHELTTLNARLLQNFPVHGLQGRLSGFQMSARLKPETETAMFKQQNVMAGRRKDQGTRGDMHRERATRRQGAGSVKKRDKPFPLIAA